MNNTPSKILSTYLTDEGLFENDLSEDWALYISHLPDTPSKIAVLYDTPGSIDGRYMNTGETVEHYGMQIFIRGDDYQETFSKLRVALEALELVENESVTVGANSYTIHAVSRTSSIISLGAEEGSKRRVSWTTNLMVSITEDES